MGSENEDDVALLLHEPQSLILKYQEIIKIIVRKYISSGMFKPEDFEDTVQTINQLLIQKIPAIQKQYNGSSLLKTYFSAIVRNICLKKFEKDKRELPTTSLDELNLSSGEDITNRLEIEYHIKRFGSILRLYSKKEEKLVFHLKLYFRFSQTSENIKRYFTACSVEDERTLLNLFGGDYTSLSIQEIYKQITPFLNKYEGKSNTADSARRWIDSKVDEIITLLNGNPPQFKYDKEALKLLAERYFLRSEEEKGYI
jgi:hypothetical protein